MSPYEFKAYQYYRSSMRGICEWSIKGQSNTSQDTVFLNGMSVSFSQTEYDHEQTCKNYWSFVLCKENKTLKDCNVNGTGLVFEKVSKKK